MRIERELPVGHPRRSSSWLNGSVCRTDASDCRTGGRVRPIIRMPDPLLRRAARACVPGDPSVAAVARDLVRTMAVHPGCRALSAPQIGRLLRIVALDVRAPARTVAAGGPGGPLLLVNPQLVVASGVRTLPERCLSVPHVVANVRRADDILVVAFSPEGGTTTLELRGAEAALLLHQLDHLDGVLTLDRLESLSDLSPLTTPAARARAYGSPRVPPSDPFRRTSA
jgi:peptide deformylase